MRVIDEKIKIASTKDAIKVLKYKILGLMNNVEILQEENLYIIREQKKRIADINGARENDKHLNRVKERRRIIRDLNL